MTNKNLRGYIKPIRTMYYSAKNFDKLAKLNNALVYDIKQTGCFVFQMMEGSRHEYYIQISFEKPIQHLTFFEVSAINTIITLCQTYLPDDPIINYLQELKQYADSQIIIMNGLARRWD